MEFIKKNQFDQKLDLIVVFLNIYIKYKLKIFITYSSIQIIYNVIFILGINIKRFDIFLKKTQFKQIVTFIH